MERILRATRRNITQAFKEASPHIIYIDGQRFTVKSIHFTKAGWIVAVREHRAKYLITERDDMRYEST